MSVDPAVRSIRIATALSERFAAILRSNNQAFQQLSISELELRIGEAQQLYPEIWTHLDEARTVIAGRGGNTAAYDAIRATEPRGSLGVSRVDVEGYSTSLTSDLFRMTDETVKTATFNVAGHQRGVAAGRALMDAMPEVDWVDIARRENAELASIGSIRALNAKSLVRYLGIAAAGVALIYAIWYVAIRTPKIDHTGEYAAAAETRKVESDQLRRELAAAPCDRRKWMMSRSRLEGDLRAIQRDLDATCRAVIARIKERLDQDPCDAADLAELEQADLWFGSSVVKSDHDLFTAACGLKGTP